MACNLRSPITGIGPLVNFFKEDLAVSYGMMGFITTIPLLIFAIFFSFVSSLSKKSA
jgi:CP family cyanate transporter-like MFS transporter